MTTLHDELADGSPAACKLCAFLQSRHPEDAEEWARELALPTTMVGNTSVVLALKRRGVSIEEASVRRHRRNHVAR
jgi:hypothetical protein